MDIPLIEQIKLQARALVPLIRALEAELGQARAHDIVRRALGAHYRALGERWWRAQQGDHLGNKLAASFERFAAADALDYEILEQSPDAFEIDVTGCRYARFFQELDVPELGFLLVCSADFDMADGFGGGVRLARTQTIMQGAGHCDFRYSIKKPDPPP